MLNSRPWTGSATPTSCFAAPVKLPDIPTIHPERRRLVVAHSVSGVRVHDARIVAAMNGYGISSLLTFNGPDFTRYPGIRVVHPNDAANSANPQKRR